jgi:long-chain acyl-CoA synthetase
MTDSLAHLLARHADDPARVLYRQWEDCDGTAGWREYTAADMLALAARWQQAFRDHGFEPGDRVAICLKNSPHWVAIDQAALGLALVVVPLYVIDNPDNIAACLEDSGARLLVLDTPRVLARLRERMSDPPAFVCVESVADDEASRLDAFLPAEAPAFEVRPVGDDTLATLVYTSGTTGRPKGVKLSHGNVLWNLRASARVIPIHGEDVALSVLPLSHMFERTCGYYLMLQAGACVAYARGVQQLGEDLATVRPTLLLAVPRLYERFLARIDQALASSRLRQWLFSATVRLGWKAFNGEASLPERVLLAALRRRVAGPVLERLGGRLRLAAAGGAKLELRIARTFIGLGLPIIQGYGMTEASPVIAANREHDNDPASVGAPLDGLEWRLTAEGELQVRGPSVMQGYWRNPEATAKVLSADGWLSTGDLVEVQEGRLHIRGRCKDIVVLSNGEKFPPEEAESALLDDPAFEQVMLVGEGHPFVCLIAVTRETDERALVRRANARLGAFPRYVRVRRVITTTEPWTVDNGLLTPTLKVKRAQVASRFTHTLARIYGEPGEAD